MIATAMEDTPEPFRKTLRDRLRSCQQAGMPGLPVQEVIRYIAEIADELDGEVRPYVALSLDTILVIDGHAHLAPRANRPVSSSDTIAGAPAYLAPEVWRGAAGPATDQYALACIYVELRTGKQPFGGSVVPVVMQRHLEEAPELGGCTKSEQKVLARALAKSASQRYSRCRDFAKELSLAIPSAD